MRKVMYGSTSIEYDIEERHNLSAHYVSVDRQSGVVLRGRRVPVATADRLVLKKARWIVEKMRAVGADVNKEIVTGSRLPYLGRQYYVQVKKVSGLRQVDVVFNYSKFIIQAGAEHTQRDIREAINTFYAGKAIEKISPRVERIAARAKLLYNRLSFRKMHKRWGSCTPANSIIINVDAVKLPFTLIDYLIIHELCHTKVKDHSKKFWAELSKHCMDWKALDARMGELNF
jgi:predicted metal-dependent hydrolase